MRASSSEDITQIETSIGYTFRKKSLLKEALTHKSYAHERQEDTVTFNERMEFLGDAVLALIVADYLFCAYPEYTESDFSKIKAYVVQDVALAEAADKINIGDYLRLGRGEERTGGRKKTSLLANAFEAILAAIYLDRGFKNAKEFVLRNLKTKMNDFVENNLIFDFKTKLQEVAQAQFGVLPKYIVHKEKGPEHNKMFDIKVFIKNKVYGSGRGKTKKAAAQKAAEEGLKKIKKG